MRLDRDNGSALHSYEERISQTNTHTETNRKAHTVRNISWVVVVGDTTFIVRFTISDNNNKILIYLRLTTATFLTR